MEKFMRDLHTHERWLFDEFADRLGAALDSLTGSRPPIEWSAVDSPAGRDPAGSLVLENPLHGINGATVWILSAESDEKKVSSAVLESAGISEADSDPETSRSSFVELIGQAVSGLCQALSGRLSREVTASTPTAREAGLPPELQLVQVAIQLKSGKAALIMAVSKPLTDALAPAERRLAEPIGAAPAKTLDLLYDVELPVSVSFGRAQLPLKDIIKLTSGSIVELNRAISEPVEIIVNNCVIARGDVVVMEGNYGVRIQQVISRQERLRTLT